MKEEFFFEIPVYRCTPEKHSEELNIQITKIKDRFKNIYLKSGIDTTESENRVIEWETMTYDYNETIGWIKLYVLGNQIRGEYFFEAEPREKRKIKQRFKRGFRKKNFIWMGKAFEMSVKSDLNSPQILAKLILKLEFLSKREKPFKNRYIDLRQLRNIGRFVDWKNLMNDLNSFK